MTSSQKASNFMILITLCTISANCHEARFKADVTFESLDTNHDGFISRDELDGAWRHAPNLSATQQNIEFSRKLFQQLDRDGDGRISLTEWRQGKFEVGMDDASQGTGT